jgi:hypothetical protein
MWDPDLFSGWSGKVAICLLTISTLLTNMLLPLKAIRLSAELRLGCHPLFTDLFRLLEPIFRTPWNLPHAPIPRWLLYVFDDVFDGLGAFVMLIVGSCRCSGSIRSGPIL